MLISRLPPNVHLQQSYETILSMLDKAHIKYETDSKIIKRYDPTILDENGDPYPKPAEGSEGTGTAWIKCYFDDRKVYFIYFCCHLVDCTSCEYDRFITIYNYTDDIIDTNLQGMMPIEAVYKCPEPGTTLDQTALYYKSQTYTLDFIDPKSLQTEEASTGFDPNCKYCHGTGIYVMPQGKKGNYSVDCPECTKTSSTESTDPIKFTKTITLYQFIAGFYTRNDAYIDIMPYDISKLTLINKFEDIETYTDAASRLFVKGVFDTKITINSGTTVETPILKDIQFFKSTYTDTNGNYIPVNVIKRISGETSTSPYMYDDMTGIDALDDTRTAQSVTDDNYANLIQTVANYTTHCVVKTFTDIFDFNGIWNYICYKDRNLTIFPLNDSLNVANTSWYIDFSLTDPTYNNFEVSDILNSKVASNYSSLDAANPAKIEYFYATGNVTFDDLQSAACTTHSPLMYQIVDSKNTYETKEISLYVSGVSNVYNCIMFNGHEEHITIKEKYIATFNSWNDPAITTGMPILVIGQCKVKEESHGQYSYSCTENPNAFIVGTDVLYEYAYNDPETGELLYHYNGKYVFERITTYTPADLDGAVGFVPLLFSMNTSFDSSGNRLINKLTLNTEITIISNSTIQSDGSSDISNIIDRTIKYPMIPYNYNNLTEGVFQYYQPLYNTYVNNFITYRYSDTTDSSQNNLIDLSSPDTYETQAVFKKRFLNILTKNRLKSIYYKEDTRDNYITCPKCEGESATDPTITCDLCKNTGKIDMYYFIHDIRFKCPSLGESETKHSITSIDKRCRCCAGSSCLIKYLFYNCYEFKDLTTYNGKIPATSEQWPPVINDELINGLTTKITTASGEKDEWPYLNYLLYKKFHINAGKTLDYDTYGEYYNHIKENVVFYFLNGDMTKYYYWNGVDHTEVNYGYNYIYSTKTYTAKEWEKCKADEQSSLVLYRILPDQDDFDNHIAFFAYSANATDGTSTGIYQQIYFDEGFIFESLSNDLEFNRFNYLQESKHVIDMGVHIHDDDAQLVEERCPACRCADCDGHGYIDGEECETCKGTGISDPNCSVCGGTGAKEDLPEIKLGELYLYKYITLSPITCNNINYETMVIKQCTCYNCNGTGKVDTLDCPKCNGTGKIGEIN